MKKLFWNIGKSALIGALAGAVASFALPALMTLMGIHSPVLASLTTATMSLFMATTAAATTTISTLAGHFLDGSYHVSDATVVSEKSLSNAPCQQTGLSQNASHFRDRILDAKRDLAERTPF